MRAVVASSYDGSVSGTSGRSSMIGGTSWICLKGSLETAKGTRPFSLMSKRVGNGPWIPVGASFQYECKIAKGDPRFVKR